MYINKQQPRDDEILVNSYVRKKKMNKPMNVNPMQRLGQKFSSMMPKLPKLPKSGNRIKGRNNNKYNFSNSWAERFVNTQKLSKFGKFFPFVTLKFFSVERAYASDRYGEFKMKWGAREKISKAQRENNSNYKHGNRLDYRHKSNWIPNEIIHHIDGNHNNNDEDNLISIPGYIPDTNEIKTLGEWKRIVNCKLHEEIHRRACKDEITLPSKEEILEMVNKEYPDYYEEIRPKLLEHYELLKIKDKYIKGNEELEQKINKIREVLNNE